MQEDKIPENPRNLSTSDEQKKTPSTPPPLKNLVGRDRSDMVEEMSKLMQDINKGHEKGHKKVTDQAARRNQQISKGMQSPQVSEERGNMPIDGDYVTGSRVFMRNCAGCHGLESTNQNRKSVTGPPLGLIYGRKAGTDRYFEYSKSYLDSQLVWSEKRLFYYLKDPLQYFPDSKCRIPGGGLTKEEDRADIARFLKMFTKNLKINLDLKNRTNFGDDYVDSYTATQKGLVETAYQRANKDRS
jgi:cytochrome c